MSYINNNSLTFTNKYPDTNYDLTLPTMANDSGYGYAIKGDKNGTAIYFTGGTQCDGFLNSYLTNQSNVTQKLYKNLIPYTFQLSTEGGEPVNTTITVYSMLLRFVIVYHYLDRNGQDQSDEFKMDFTDNNDYRFRTSGQCGDIIDTTSASGDVCERRDNQTMVGFDPYGNRTMQITNNDSNKTAEYNLKVRKYYNGPNDPSADTSGGYAFISYGGDPNTHFVGWSTSVGGSVAYYPGDAFVTGGQGQTTGTLKFFNDIHLYPVFESDQAYSVSVFFDSTEIVGSGITVQ